MPSLIKLSWIKILTHSICSSRLISLGRATSTSRANCASERFSICCTSFHKTWRSRYLLGALSGRIISFITTPPLCVKSWVRPVSSLYNFSPALYAAEATAERPPARLTIFIEQWYIDMIRALLYQCCCGWLQRLQDSIQVKLGLGQGAKRPCGFPRGQSPLVPSA